MRPLPTRQLDPRIKNVWRLNDGLWLTGIAVACVLVVQVTGLFTDADGLAGTVVIVIGAVYALALAVCLGVLPPIRYMRWRYEVTPEYLDISQGIIWRTRLIVPFIRVQNTDTRQGPILRLFGLASVTVSTAAGEHEIPGLSEDVAEQLRDRAAELARLAREDV